MASVSCVLLSEDQFLCSICLEVFTDPVTTPCGHSFCCSCINKHWDNSDHCHCPVCKEEFSSRPKIKINTFMLEMVSEFKNKPQSEDRESSESESVLCDVCPDPKLQALKSCLMCQTSYCQLHLQPHHTLPRLQKHQLIAPVKDLEERICPEHDRLLEFFCRDHSEIICLQCIYTEHRDHNTVPLKEQCEEQQKDLQQKIQERREKIQEIQSSVQLSQKNADREMEEGEEFFKDLLKCVQESLDQFKLNIEEKHEEIKKKAEEFIENLESEISSLEQRRSEMEEIWRSEDHFDLVQTFTSVKPAPELHDWTEESVRAPSYKGRVATAVSELQNKRLTPKIKELFEEELKQAKQHAVDVTLDPDTAHPKLDLDLREMKMSEDQELDYVNDPVPTAERHNRVHSGRRLKVTVLRVAVVLALVLIVAFVFDGVAIFFPPCPFKLHCGTDWELNGKVCYHFSTNPLPWIQSEAKCKSMGGQLVKIDSRQEQMFLNSELETLSENEDKFWIGLTDFETEGVWKWTDGSSLDPSSAFWFGDNNYVEPNNWSSNDKNPEGEDCAQMGVMNPDYEGEESWFDHHCSLPYKYICEKKPTQVPECR